MYNFIRGNNCDYPEMAATNVHKAVIINYIVKVDNVDNNDQNNAEKCRECRISANHNLANTASVGKV